MKTHHFSTSRWVSLSLYPPYIKTTLIPPPNFDRIPFFGVQRFSFGLFLELFFLIPKAKALDSKIPALEQTMNLTVTQEGLLTFLMRKVGKDFFEVLVF